MRASTPTIFVLTAVMMAACGSGSSSSANFAPIATTVTPATGSLDVEPDVAISLVFAQAVADPAEFVRIEDAGVVLPGQFVAGASATDWTWQPDPELPRGGQIVVNLETPVGDVVASTFSVREARDRTVLDLAGIPAYGAKIWPNGRRILTSFANSWELTQSGVIELFVKVPDTSMLYGDGEFVWVDAATTPDEVVRGDLAGNVARIPLPNFARGLAANARGDLLTFVQTGSAPPNAWGPWRLAADETQWQWLGSIEQDSQPGLTIDQQGDAWLGLIEAGRPRIAHFEDGNLVPRYYDLPASTVLSEPADRVAVGISPHGEVVLGWRQLVDSWHAARLDANGNLVRLPESGTSAQPGTLPPPSSSAQWLEAVHIAPGGEATLRIRESFNGGSFPLVSNSTLIRRVTRRNAWLAEESILLEVYPYGAHVAGGLTPVRGEGWRIPYTPDVTTSLTVARSRPGEASVELGDLYPNVRSGTAIAGVVVAVNDSGRAVFLVRETGSNTRHVVVWD